MASSPSPESGAGVLAGRYAIRRKLGAGSMGTVYLAHDQLTARPVALKVLRGAHAAAPARRRMEEEFRVIASLQHPRIARAYDFGFTDSGAAPFYTREYVKGAPLAAGPPRGEDPAGFLRPIIHLLDALEHVHEHGILHLDIHAGNLIVAEDHARGSVLIDFGLFPSRLRPILSESPSLTGMAPEALRGEPLTERTDLYLVGGLLRFRLTGRAAGEPRLPPEIPGWGTRLTLELERIAVKALQPFPSQRFASAAEFRDALLSALGEREPRQRRIDPQRATLGREGEVRRIESAMRDAAGGGAAALWLTAREGLGKTRLLSEARLLAQLLGLQAIEVGFSRHSEADALLRAALRKAVPRRRGRSRGGSQSWLEPLSPEFGGTPEERARRAAECYFTEEGPALVLLLDDVEHADRDSLMLMEALAREGARRRAAGLGGRGLAIIAASGSPRPPRKSPFQVHALKPLRPAHARRLFLDFLQPLTPAPGLLRRALARAAGSPLHLRRLSLALREEWKQSGTIPASADLPPLDAPVALFRRRGTMAGDDRRIINLLLALGREARRDEIACALELPAGAVARSLRRLTRLEGISASGRGSTRRYGLTAAAEDREPPRKPPELLLPELSRRKTNPPWAEAKRPDTLRRPSGAEEVEAACRGRCEGGSASPAKQTEQRGDQLGLGSRALARAARRLRLIHLRLASLIASWKDAGAIDCENRARHLLAAGQRAEGRRVALRAAKRLRAEGLFERGVALLEEAAGGENDLERRLELVGEASSILEETGDHERGITLLQSFLRAAGRGLKRAARVEYLRRLGVHYHRAGDPRRALQAFARARRLAHPRRDLADLVFIDSELAELHTFRGAYQEAEEACRRGLSRLEERDLGVEFRGRTEVMLRASLGHIELRRLSLAAARKELRMALKLSARFGALGDRAAILHNLGIVENLASRFGSARRAFSGAERLLRRAGERRNVVKVCTNLALIAAKLGDRDGAHGHLERAASMLRQHPGQRLACFVAYSRGVVANCLGDCEEAVTALEFASRLARRLGDRSLGSFAALHLAESLLASGKYHRAVGVLRSALRSTTEQDSPAIERMAFSRLALAHAAMGRRRRAARWLRSLEEAPRSDLLYPEAWNDLFAAMSRVLAGERPGAGLERARQVFHRLRVTAGERLAELTAVAAALADGGDRRVSKALAILEQAPPSRHSFLAVAVPLAAAEERLARGETEEAERRLAAATSAIVGTPFLELDWRLDLLRARIEKRKGDLRDARRHLHRALHTRDLLLQHLPPTARKRFLAQPRFTALAELAGGLKAPPGGEVGTTLLLRSQFYEGMVGRSAALEGVVRAVERLRDQDLPVLITGETGAGKELVARALHRRSHRALKPFKAIHCACLPPELFESEVFGHQAGAFTGAETSQAGLLEDADGGVVLFDHLDELHPASQAKLLRVLETGAFRPLGAEAEKRVDVRYLATAPSDLRRAVELGNFRADLYYRLAKVEIHVPPLRERREDLPELARHFLERHAARLDRTPVPVLDEEALDLLSRHGWPGNVRELETVLLRAAINLPAAEKLTARDLEPLLEPSSAERFGAGRFGAGFSGAGLLGRGLDDWRRDLESEYLKQLFAKHAGDPRAVFKELGIGRTKLYSWLRALGLDVRQLRRAP